MSDYGGDDDFDGLYDDADGDWLYVEDAWDEADELAEQTCPSPTIPEYIPDEDVDPYEYFIDLDYLSDGYYDDRADVEVRKKGKRKLEERRQVAAHHAGSNKRQRTRRSSFGSTSNFRTFPRTPCVVYVTQSDRSCDPSFYVETTRTEGLATVSLFRDWRTRFQNHQGLSLRPVTHEVQAGNATPKKSIPRRPILVQNDLAFEMVEGEEEEEEEGAGSGGEGLDLEGMGDIASMLTDGHKEELLKLLEAKGIDPAALDMVMEDLAQGRKRDFHDDENEDEDAAEDAADHEGEQREDQEDEVAKGDNDDRRKSDVHGENDDRHAQPSKRKAGLMDFGGDGSNDEKPLNARPRSRPLKRMKSRAERTVPLVSSAEENDSRLAQGGGTKRKASEPVDAESSQTKRSKPVEEPSSVPTAKAATVAKGRMTRSSRK
ncbi:MAG: hypothetical protein Q9162_001991 [Coniocarpon cinnabarinum]